MTRRKRQRYGSIFSRTTAASPTTRRCRYCSTRRRSTNRSGRPRTARIYLPVTVWGGVWIDGVFYYHHYHSNAHEVLCVVGGRARIAFGGPEGVTIEAVAGDLVVIPAGVGHKNEGSSGDFSLVGAYPRGQVNYDLRTGEEGERPEVLENICGVAVPKADPLFGEEGPLLWQWAE